MNFGRSILYSENLGNCKTVCWSSRELIDFIPLVIHIMRIRQIPQYHGFLVILASLMPFFYIDFRRPLRLTLFLLKIDSIYCYVM
jgi:hypothetical protein